MELGFMKSDELLTDNPPCVVDQIGYWKRSRRHRQHTKQVVFRRIMVFLVVFLISLIGIIIVSRSGNVPLEPDSASTMTTYLEREGRRIARERIEPILKCPSTAEWPRATVVAIKVGDHWQVHGSVDAQNSYGAMLRGRWSVELWYRSSSSEDKIWIGRVTLDGEEI
jgi:hypothetical protein